jgi:SAM-dependent methyltransferase
VPTRRYDASLPTAERKRHGVFYTPEAVTRYLVRATAPRGPVADLSCGDGAFLEAAAHQGVPVIGIDRDAAALARIALPGATLIHGDGLSLSLPQTPDVVLGNPPYLEAKKADPALKAQCRARFPRIARGGFDVFVCFLQAGLDALPPGGRLGYIVPNKFLVADYARPLREALLADTTIEEVIDVSDLPTFRDAAVYPVLLVVRKAPPPAGHRVRTGVATDLAQLDDGTFPRAEVRQAAWAANGRSIWWLPPTDPTARALVDRLVESHVRLGDVLDIRWTISFHRAGLRDAFIFPAPTGACPMRLLGGKRFHGNADVGRYRTAWSGWWIDYDLDRARAAHNTLPPRALFDGDKLVIAQNARRILATLDRDGFACKDTFLVGRARDGAPPLPFLLALLNSSLLSYLYGVMFKATHVGGAYLHYLGCYLDELPVRLTDPAPFVALVERLLDPAEPDRHALDAALDDLVFDLYDCSAEERAVVRAAIPHAWGEPGARRGAWNALEAAP